MNSDVAYCAKCGTLMLRKGGKWGHHLGQPSGAPWQHKSVAGPRPTDIPRGNVGKRGGAATLAVWKAWHDAHGDDSEPWADQGVS